MPSSSDEAALVERVALAMARSEGNEDAQRRAVSNNFDALGYTALARVALDEMRVSP